MKQSRGFTLIELLVVISIISILASVVLAALNTARDKGRVGAGRYFAAQIDHIASDYAVGIWDFDECGGTTAADRSGNNNNASFTGTPTWPTTTFSGTGCALGFDGATQFADMGNGSSLNMGTSDFTFAFWVKSTDTSGYKGIVTKGALIATDAGFKVEVLSGTSRISVYVSNGSAYTIGFSPTVTVIDGLWHHVAVVGNRTSNAVLYVDGSVIATQAFTDSASPGSISGATTLKVASGNAGVSRYLQGSVDNVRVYAKALTASEIGRVYALESRLKFASK